MGTLTITFTPPIEEPAYGYTVKYHLVGEIGNWQYSTGHTGSPIEISGLADGCYEGTIISVCGVHGYGSEEIAWQGGVGGICGGDESPEECRAFLITAGDSGSSIEWYDCDGNFQGLTLAPGETHNVCVSGGGLVTADGASEQYLGVCT